jgi:PAS domain S-box-containing protein
MSDPLLELEDRLLQSVGAGVCLVRPDDGRILYANTRLETILGYGPGELEGRSLQDTGCGAILQRPTEAAEGPIPEFSTSRKDGASLCCRASVARLEHPRLGSVLVTTLADVSEQRTAEERLRASLEEKEVLLREIHHRVKNNLQMVSSMLNLQARSTRDPVVRAVFKENQARLRALALLHERLYRSEKLARIGMAEYLESLLQSLVRAAGAPGQSVSIAIEVEPAELSVDLAIPMGLIVNELASNSLKHAFPESRTGSLRVELRKSAPGQLVLLHSDNGVGLPAGLDPLSSHTLGMELVRTLVRQLGGAVAWRNNGGTEVEIRFPAPP